MVKMPTPTPTPISSPGLGSFEALEEGVEYKADVEGLERVLWSKYGKDVESSVEAVQMGEVIAVFSTGSLAVSKVSEAVGRCG